MAMVNLLNGKDSRWLQLEVCREFQRNKCSRPDTECKFAHPPANVEVQNGRVTACYDSIKGRCNREKPPCKYFHPPQHLKDQLLINGRNHLALKNALMQQMGLTPGQQLVPGQVQAVAANPYLAGMPQVGSTYSPYFAPGPIMPTIMGPDPTGVGSPLGVVPQTVVTQQKMPRSDRLEVCREYQRGACKRAESECRFAHPADSVTANEDGTVTVCMDAVKGRCNRDPCRYFHPPLHLQAQIKAAQSRASAMDMKSVGSFYYDNFAFPAGMVPYKRPAADKSGVPVYQPNATTYQQLVQLQQPFVPVSCEYSTSPAPPPTSSSASPSATEQAAAAAAAAAALHPAMSSSLSNPQQQQQQQQQQLSKENEPQPLQIPASITTTASLTSLPAQQLAAMTDPAAIAKEVAQQNYAKAVKLAAVNQSLAASQLNALNPLNYTGVSLNKQTINVPPPTAALRYPSTAIPFTFNAAAAAAAAGLNLGLTHNPYSAAAFAQQNLLNVARPPPAMTAFQFNPYSLMRPGYANANPAAAATPLLGGNFLGAQYPVVSAVAAAPTATVPAATSTIAAAAAQNNNNVVVQPYKKLKTS
ncbi:muscleblind-like protein 1 isoform X2 [Cylas formicarius]|uniref:muscleblind-like protein 1 isoform X2 n=1 Tax=Cylas formicarius TaxID=197179 RepID=UPI00295833A5|nr:muscleblind-like protein 1 isoform X2 [Cylas formicarius]